MKRITIFFICFAVIISSIFAVDNFSVDFNYFYIKPSDKYSTKIYGIGVGFLNNIKFGESKFGLYQKFGFGFPQKIKNNEGQESKRKDWDSLSSFELGFGPTMTFKPGNFELMIGAGFNYSALHMKVKYSDSKIFMPGLELVQEGKYVFENGVYIKLGFSEVFTFKYREKVSGFGYTDHSESGFRFTPSVGLGISFSGKNVDNSSSGEKKGKKKKKKGHEFEVSQVRDLIKSGDMIGAEELILASEEQYPDELLFYFDAGWVSYFNGKYNEAIGYLEEAKKLADDRKAESFSNDLGKFFANDRATDYVAENYEDVYINLCLALCYHLLGQDDEAFVEIRQVNTKLADLSRNEKDQANKIKDFILDITPNPYGDFKPSSVPEYTTSSFASYLSMIFYRDLENNIDEARVDYKRLKNIFDDSVLNVDKDKVHMNVISLEGICGEKQELSYLVDSNMTFKGAVVTATLQAAGINIPPFPVIHKVAIPTIQQESPKILQTVISCSNGEKIVLSSNKGVVEDVEKVAGDTLMFRSEDAYLRSYYRGYLKVETASVAAYVAHDKAIKAAGKIGNQLGQKAAVLAADKAFDLAMGPGLDALRNTESADLRMAVAMPSKIRVSDFSLVPGTYDFLVEYFLSDGQKITKEFKSVEVARGKLNLIVAECVR